MREPPCGGFPWGTRQNWTLTLDWNFVVFHHHASSHFYIELIRRYLLDAVFDKMTDWVCNIVGKRCCLFERK
jgi:hypothetical protein